MRTEAQAMKILKDTVREPAAVYLREVSGGNNTLRVSIRPRVYGEARAAIAALFGGITRLKHIYDSMTTLTFTTTGRSSGHWARASWLIRISSSCRGSWG